MNSEGTEAQICKRLESVRLMKNISQSVLAEKAGVSRRTISRMENGHGISLDTFIRVMTALGLTSNLESVVPSADIRPIERVKQNRERKHASSPRKPISNADEAKETKWTWGDS